MVKQCFYCFFFLSQPVANGLFCDDEEMNGTVSPHMLFLNIVGQPVTLLGSGRGQKSILKYVLMDEYEVDLITLKIMILNYVNCFGDIGMFSFFEAGFFGSFCSQITI